MLKRRRNYNLIKIASAALCLIIAFTAATFSWFSRYNTIDFPNAYGGTAKAAYFASGDGSKNDPYKIKTAVHLYNFAWLQYLGYFNLNPTLNNGRAQSYFELDDNVDMSVLNSALPPIGTAQYPFIGGFNGANYSIYNLTVSNQKSDLTVRPLNAHIADSSAANAGRLLAATQNGEVSVVGLFGVVGDYNAFIADNYKGKSVAGAEIVINDSSTDFPADYSQIAVNEFYHKGMYVKNFYVDKVHVKSYSKKTLLGLAAGYVNAAMQNVGVYRCDVSFAAGATGLTDDYGTIVSKYSLIGDYNKTAVSWGEDPTAGSTGGDSDEPDWGGSIDMESVYNRVYDIWKNNTEYYDSNYNTVTYNTNMKRYRDTSETKHGSFYYNYLSQEGLLYLDGGKVTASVKPVDMGEISYYIQSGTGYLNLNSTGTATQNSTDSTSVVTWSFSDEGYIYSYIGGVKKYLTKGQWGPTVSISETPTTVWFYNKQNNQIYCDYNGSNAYLGLDGSYWRANTTQTAWTVSLKESEKTMAVVNEYAYQGADGQSWSTYFPLNAYSSNGSDYLKYDVNKKTNTGYVMSGFDTTGGDIRISKQTITAISSSISGTYDNGSTMSIYTRSASTNGFVGFTDKYGSAENGKALGLKKYEQAKLGTDEAIGFDDVIKQKTSIYGMHFMNASISTHKIVVAPKVIINGFEYTNYQMPADSIDFKVKTKGYVNFFAGTYYGSDKNFFSLHQIFRNEDDTIAEIKEISKIYEKTNGKGDYVYAYKNESFTIPAGYDSTPVFDTDWITNPTIVLNAVYYFEIPVNAGEYALGSASTGDGAYLMYLDIGASGIGGGDNPSPGDEKDYTMTGVDFVNTPSVTPAADGSYPAFKDVTVALSDVSETEAAQTIYMRNNNGLTDSSGQIADTLRYKYKNITAVVSPNELGDDKSDDDTFVPSTDTD